VNDSFPPAISAILSRSQGTVVLLRRGRSTIIQPEHVLLVPISMHFSKKPWDNKTMVVRFVKMGMDCYRVPATVSPPFSSRSGVFGQVLLVGSGLDAVPNGQYCL
jgi:hypothetical protein